MNEVWRSLAESASLFVVSGLAGIAAAACHALHHVLVLKGVKVSMASMLYLLML